MCVISLQQGQSVYVVLGIDGNEHDQVLAVSISYQEAKNFCVQCKCETEFYDMWIEKHQLL